TDQGDRAVEQDPTQPDFGDDPTAEISGVRASHGPAIVPAEAAPRRRPRPRGGADERTTLLPCAPAGLAREARQAADPAPGTDARITRSVRTVAVRSVQDLADFAEAEDSDDVVVLEAQIG